MCALYRSGNIWWYTFQFQGRRIQESTGMMNETAAQQAETIRKAALLERRAGIARKPLPPKFEEYVPKFLAWSKQQHRRKTYDLHSTNLDTLLRYFSGKWLDEITPGMVEDFKLARIREERRNAHDGSTVSPATVNRALTTLRLMFNYASRCGLAVQNPTRGVQFLEENPGRMRVLTFEEELAYMQTVNQPCATSPVSCSTPACDQRKSSGWSFPTWILSAVPCSTRSARPQRRKGRFPRPRRSGIS